MATKKQQRRKYQRAQGRGRLYEGYDVSPIIAPRAISAKASTRGDVTEV